MLRVVLVSVLVAIAAGSTLTSQGTAGEVCQAGDASPCPPEESVCADGKCTCLKGKGTPGLLCINDPAKDKQCSTTNDPIVSTFENGVADIPVPCQFLMTDIKRDYKNRNDVVTGTCEYQVYSFNKRVGGKFYPGGFEVHIKYVTTSNKEYYRGFSVVGSATGGQYTYDLKASTAQGFDSWESYERANSGNYKIEYRPFTFAVDTKINRVTLSVSSCDLVVKFRAVDDSVDVFNQPGLPGVAVNVGLNAEFPAGNSKAVCLSPSVKMADLIGSYETKTAFMMSRAFASSAHQNFPNTSPICSTIDDAFGKCNTDNEKKEVADTCSDILTTPRFVNCYTKKYPDGDSNSNSILGLVQNCVRFLCDGNNAACSQIQSNINGLPQACKDVAPSEIKYLGCP